MIPEDKVVPAKNPTELLYAQVLLLREVQQALLEMRQTQTQMGEILRDLHQVICYIAEAQAEAAEVEVAEFRMSLGAMVEFVLKGLVVGIPAALILAGLGALTFPLVRAVLGWLAGTG